MAIKVKQQDGTFKYKCFYCNKLYIDPTKADQCRDENHDLVYVPISRSDLELLINFIYTKDDSLLTESMIRSLKIGKTKL